ncbi:MAG: SH3 domain-containing protein [Planctomycetota bacterium]|jgi:hypothetical protein
MKSPNRILYVLVFYAAVLTLPLIAQDEDAITGYCRLNEAQDLWSGPSKNFKKVREADEGLLLKVIGQKGDYYRVQVPDGFQCYISSEFLEVDENSVGTVTGNRVNLRSIPRIKGDYPIYQVGRGDRLYVWERVGDWYCVTAPVEAYLYVRKDAVTFLEDSDALQAEYETLSGGRTGLWENHLGQVQQRKDQEEKEDAIDQNLVKLERAAAAGFKEIDLLEAAKGYDEIAATTEDEKVRQLAKARSSEIDALIARKQAEEALKTRESSWRKELDALKKAIDDKIKPVKPKPATHKEPGQGRLVTVIGIMDAQGPQITLRGGKTPVDTLYRVESPDGRYILGDFHSRRVSILGRIGDIVTREQPPLVVVERLEILK